MRNNSVIIATNAIFLANTLRNKLMSIYDFQAYVAENDDDLGIKIKAAFPRFIFLEHCFHGYGTDVFIQRMLRHYRGLSIVVWAALELKPLAAARFIAAGAESFFSLRDTEENIEAILFKIANGQHYYPSDVETLLDKDFDNAAIGKKLTSREMEVFKMAIAGKSNKKICDVLSLTKHTVKYHKANIYRKCGGNRTLGNLINGLKQGIINLEDLE